MIRTTTVLSTSLLIVLAAACDQGNGESETTATEGTETGGEQAETAAAGEGEAEGTEGEQAEGTEGDEAAAEGEPPEVDHATAEGVHGEEMTYAAGDTEMRGYLAYKEGQQGERPGVLVVHEWWGHNAYARKRADTLAKMGYTALAVDMYGGGKQAGHPDDAKKFSSRVNEDMDEAKARFMAAKKVLSEHETTDPEKMAAIGYCFGGGVVLNMARMGVDLDVVASFHGMLKAKEPAEEGDIEADKILVYHGAADPFVPPEQVEAFEKEMKNAGVDFVVEQYDGAKHAFTNPEATAMGKKHELPIAYDEEADKKSWEHFSKQLEEIFGGQE